MFWLVHSGRIGIMLVLLTLPRMICSSTIPADLPGVSGELVMRDSPIEENSNALENRNDCKIVRRTESYYPMNTVRVTHILAW